MRNRKKNVAAVSKIRNIVLYEMNDINHPNKILIQWF